MECENEFLSAKLVDLTNVCDSLHIENSNLIDEIDCLVAFQYDVPCESNVKLDKN